MEKTENDSHYIELLAASSALSFYNEDESVLAVNKQNVKTDYEYCAIMIMENLTSKILWDNKELRSLPKSLAY